MTVQDDDQLLVCRNSTPYNLKTQNLMAELLDDDLMLVCRSGTPYKATGLEIKESIGPQEAPPSLTSATLVDDNPTGADRYSNSSFTTTLNWVTKGVPEASVEMQATVTGELDIAGATDEIVGITPGQAGVTSQVPLDLTGDWLGILGVIPTDTSGPVAVFPDGSGTSNPKGEFFWAGMTVGDKITLYCKRASGTGNPQTRPVAGDVLETSVPVSVETLGSFELTVTAASGSAKVDFSGPTYCYGITPGGADTTLTLASDANLANGAFKAGDTVKQSNSPVVPTSSAITNVAGYQYSNGADPVVVTRPTGGGSWADVFNGSLETDGKVYVCEPVGSARQITWSATGAGFPSGIPFTSLRVRVALRNGGLCKVNGTTVANNTGAGYFWIDCAAQGVTSPLNTIVMEQQDVGNGECFLQAYLAAVEVDGVILKDGVDLTLTNSDGLSNFAVGDVVQGNPDWDQSQEWSDNAVTTSGIGWTNLPNLFDGNLTNYAHANGDGSPVTVTQTFDPPVQCNTSFTVYGGLGAPSGTVGQAVLKINGGNDTQLFAVSATPTGSDTTVVSFTGLISNITIERTVAGTNSGLYLYSYGVDNTLLVDASVVDPNAIKITAISESTPSITTDGGSWSGTDGTGDQGDGRYEPSQEWSSVGTVTGAAYSAVSGAEAAFDGEVATGDGAAFAAASNFIKYVFNPPLSMASASYFMSSNGEQCVFNEGEPDEFVDSSFSTAVIEKPLVLNSGFLKSWKVSSDASLAGFYLWGLKVNGKLLVNNSVPGGPGETFVTGPTTNITATFVSADPSVPSMTVSNVVGPWSANTGNYVVNTVVNPVLIKPETSAITVVGALELDNKSAIWSANCTQDPSWPQGADFGGMFNGDNTIHGYWRGNTFFDIAPGIQVNSSLQLRMGAEPGTGITTQLKLNGQHLNPPIDLGDNEQLFTFDITAPISIARVELDPPLTASGGGAACKIYEWIVDGKVLIDSDSPVSLSETVLTLTNDTDLNQFATGDNVYAAGVAGPSFAPVIYTGNSGTQSITTGTAPDLVWIKRRNGANSHFLYDTVRGFANGNAYELRSDTTAIEGVPGNASSGLTSFNSDGFSLGSDGGSNGNTDTFVAWCWSASDTTVTNNEGTIQSQVRSNGDFSIVKYTCPSSTTNQTFGHGLSSAPAFAIIKATGRDSNWDIYSKSLGFNATLTFTAGTTRSGALASEPTDTVIATQEGFTQQQNDSYIAYCWSDSPTQSFGEYTGSGASGNQIDVGFEPAFVMIKCTTDNANWFMLDIKRGGAAVLNPNTNDAEATGTDMIEFNSTGFNIVTSTWEINYAGRNFIYAAFATGAGPSGVVGDITGLDMTLSESTGTWEVGQKVTMDEKPAVVSTANVIFDQTGAVSGISTLPVAGQLILDKDTPKLTFTTPGTGQTWDEELPAGTKLQTSFVATNTEGSSSATSNVVTPGVTTLLAMGQTTTNKEELAQTIVQMETFDERKAIVTGEAAKSKIKGKAEAAQNKVEAAQNEVKKARL